MEFLNNLDNDSLLVIPYNIKDKVLEYINNLDKLINTKIISLDELKKELLFDIKEEAVLFVMKEYKVKKSIAEDYLRNIYYVEDKDYNNEKLNLLVEIKNKLESNNLLIKDDLLKKHYSNKKVYVYGYDYIDSFNKKLLSNFNNVEIINKNKIKDTNLVYEFNNLTDEVYFLLEKISSLLDNNVPLENIIITNTNEDYEREIYKLFNMSGIPVQIYKNTSIASTIIGKNTLEILNENKSLSDTLTYIEETYNMELESINKIYSKILSIFNRYNPYDYDFDIIYECIKDDFNKEKINLNKINGIRIESFSNTCYTSEEHVFFVGFNDGEVPRIHKDEDYITDNIKPLLGLDETYKLNTYEKESLINNILSTDNLYISYKHNYKSDEFFKSNLVDDKILINSTYEINKDITYSEVYTRLMLSNYIDELIKYGKHDPYLDVYYNSIDNNYREFDNKFKGINKEELKEYLDNKLTISYSTLNTFYNCSFRFYLDNILRINSFEESYYTFIGNLFHYCLSKVYEDNFDLKSSWDYFIKDREFTPKEKFYTDKLYKELELIIEYIKEFNKDTGLTDTYTEKRIEIDKSHNLNVIFKGFVDKIMYKEKDGNTYVSIIDYKTGNQEVDLRDTYYGLSMQLPTYLYLIDKGKVFNNYTPVGFYLQKILSKEVKIDKNVSYKEAKFKNLKLHGYSIDDEGILARFDPTYDNSKYIESMKLTKNGFSSYAKVLSKEQMKEIVNLVDNKIDNMIEDIEEAKFDINPKALSNDPGVTGCSYCPYKDICFRKNIDIEVIDKQSDLSFLEEYKGDQDE